jgi:hypothetical protein
MPIAVTYPGVYVEELASGPQAAAALFKGRSVSRTNQKEMTR